AVALAASRAPERQLGFVFLPSGPEQPYRISFVEPGAAHGTPSTLAVVDPWTRRLVTVIDPKDFTVAETVLAWQRALHAGQGLGLVWKLLTALMGLLPLFFAITGISFWWLRRRAAARHRPATATDNLYSTGRVEQ